MNNILIINHSNPFAHGGGSYACHAFTKAFAEWADGIVDIFIDAENKFPIDETIKVTEYIEVAQRPLWERLLSIINGDIQRYKRFVKNHLKRNPNRYSYVIINGSFEAGAMVDIFHHYNIKVVTIHHNYDPDFVRDNYKRLTKVFTRHSYRLQKKAYLRSDYNLFLTQDDIEKCRNEYGVNTSVNELLGVFEFAEIPVYTEHRVNDNVKFVITGSLCTPQGVDGIKFFFNELYKYLPGESELIIAGRSPTREVVNLCKQHGNVKLIANPENMNNVISDSDVYICPTRLGGGLKLRIMDGLKQGLPVVTHSSSARGYDIFRGTNFFFSYDTPSDFSKSIKEVVENLNKKTISPKVVYDTYVQSFSYEAGLERINKIMK